MSQIAVEFSLQNSSTAMQKCQIQAKNQKFVACQVFAPNPTERT